ncbi:MAG: YhbY family RNA-binding protein [Sulfuritalea sp.]|nr:YhbY family RNA-binding protein [Sulfuritalea sp.]
MTENTNQLSPIQRRTLRAAAHHLNPVVSISQKGLTPSVLAEIDRSLKAHELIKLRLYGIERDNRDALFTEICTSLNCATVQHIGNLLVLWRENPKEAIEMVPARTRKSAPMTKKQAAARNETRARRR